MRDSCDGCKYCRFEKETNQFLCESNKVCKEFELFDDGVWNVDGDE
jgi:hypothetical protein